MPDYPVMTNFYKFVAMIWTNDYLKRTTGIGRPLIETADRATDGVHQRVSTDARSAPLHPNETGSQRYLRAHKSYISKAAEAIAMAQADAITNPAAYPAGIAPDDPVWAAAVPGPPALAVRVAGGPGAGTGAGAQAIVTASNAWTLALKEQGVEVKPHRIIYVHRNTATEYHYVIPEPPATDPTLLENWAETAVPYAMTCD